MSHPLRRGGSDAAGLSNVSFGSAASGGPLSARADRSHRTTVAFVHKLHRLSRRATAGSSTRRRRTAIRSRTSPRSVTRRATCCSRTRPAACRCRSRLPSHPRRPASIGPATSRTPSIQSRVCPSTPMAFAARSCSRRETIRSPDRSRSRPAASFLRVKATTKPPARRWRRPA